MRPASELATLAVAEERNRIARDLHDMLGHSLSSIALKSELAGRLLPDEPERARAEIADVEQVAREALASVRETVGGYRQPSSRWSSRRADGARGRGYRGDVEPVPDGLPSRGRCRPGWAVREGVTNVSATATPATRIRVAATGPAARRGRRRRAADAGAIGASRAAAGSGTGLDGLRERVATVGGRLEAGPGPPAASGCIPCPSRSPGPAA